MTSKRMIELLETEHECMLRASHNDCDRNCENCELVQDDNELHEMYTNVINIVKANSHIEPKKETALDIIGLWNDDITFCQEDCDWEDCPRNSKNIRDRSIPHSYSIERPTDCPKGVG